VMQLSCFDVQNELVRSDKKEQVSRVWHVGRQASRRGASRVSPTSLRRTNNSLRSQTGLYATLNQRL